MTTITVEVDPDYIDDRASAVVQSALETEVEKNVVSVLSFGAVGDGVTDDTLAIQAAIDFCEGNDVSSLFFPFGSGQVYKLTQKIIIRKGDLHIYGFGGNKVYQDKCYIFSTEPNGILFDYGNGESNPSKSLTVSGLAFYGNVSKNQTCFKFSQANDGPHRAIVFRDCSMVRFDKALHFDTPSATLAPSLVHIQDCNFRQNNYTILADDTVLGLRFVANQSEDGGRIEGKINSWAEITNNMLESNEDCIKLHNTAGGCAVTIRDNYFEAMSGDYVVSLSHSNQNNSIYRLGANYDGASNTVKTNYLLNNIGTVVFEQHGDSSQYATDFVSLGNFGELLPGSIGFDRGYSVETTGLPSRTVSTFSANIFAGQFCSPTLRNTSLGPYSAITPTGSTDTALRLTSGMTGFYTIAKSGNAGDLVVYSLLCRYEDYIVPSGWNGGLLEIYDSGITADFGAGLSIGSRFALDRQWHLVTFTTTAPQSFSGVSARFTPYSGASSGAGCVIAGVCGEVYNNPNDYQAICPFYPFF